MVSSLETTLMDLTGRGLGCRLPTALIHMGRDGEIITNTPSSVTVRAIQYELELPNGGPSPQNTILESHRRMASRLPLAINSE